MWSSFNWNVLILNSLFLQERPKGHLVFICLILYVCRKKTNKHGKPLIKPNICETWIKKKKTPVPIHFESPMTNKVILRSFGKNWARKMTEYIVNTIVVLFVCLFVCFFVLLDASWFFLQTNAMKYLWYNLKLYL